VASRGCMEPDLDDFVQMMDTVNPDIVLVTQVFFKIPDRILNVIRNTVKKNKSTFLVEDCAQTPLYAYGPLSEHTDVYMFSFGRFKQLSTGCVTSVGIFNNEFMRRLFVDEYSTRPERGFVKECIEIIVHQVYVLLYNDFYWVLASFGYDDMVLYAKLIRRIELPEYIRIHNVVPGWASSKIARVFVHNSITSPIHHSVIQKVKRYNDFYGQNIPPGGNYMYPVINIPQTMKDSISKEIAFKNTSMVSLDTERCPESIVVKTVY